MKFSAMRNLFFLLVAAVGVAVVAPAPVYARNDDDDEKPTKAPVNQANLSRAFISEIKALADELGYTITTTKKADIITEFLAQQEG